jgi:hypothetical protein
MQTEREWEISKEIYYPEVKYDSDITKFLASDVSSSFSESKSIHF